MSVRRLFEAIFAVALWAMAVVETLDPDMWWHLRTGEYILVHGLPRQDVFSFTVSNYAWITHEWLAQVLMWLVYLAGGLPGLMLVFAALIALSYLLVYLVCEGRPYIAVFLVLLAAIASSIVWGARPQIFNMLFTAVVIFIIEKRKKEQIRRVWLLFLPLLMVVWANLHSGYLLGIVLLGTYAVGETLQQWRGSDKTNTLSWADIRLMVGVTVASFLLAAINPSGTALWIYPFETLNSPSMQQYIIEWQSPNFHAPMFWPFAIMVAIGGLVIIYSPKRPSFSQLLLFFGTVAAGFLSARHIPLFTLIALPPITYHANEIFRSWRPNNAFPNSPRHNTLLSLLNWLILVLIVVGAVVWAANKISNNEDAIARIYPVAAVDFLEQQGLAQENGYNSYNWGGYLIWREIPVFIDGRADVYGDDFIFYYLKTFELKEDWQEPLSDFHITYVIMEKDSSLGILLIASSQWQEIYSDEVAQIFTRSD